MGDEEEEGRGRRREGLTDFNQRVVQSNFKYFKLLNTTKSKLSGDVFSPPYINLKSNHSYIIRVILVAQVRTL